MRPPSDASSAPWVVRFFRPWLVASLAGLGLGFELMQLGEPPEATYYVEYSPQAAVQDSPTVQLAPATEKMTAAAGEPDASVIPVKSLLEDTPPAFDPWSAAE